MVGKEVVLLECPTLIFNVEDLPDMKDYFDEYGSTENESGETLVKYGFVDYGVLERAEGGNEIPPIVYRIFVDRIEFDLKALEVYIKTMETIPGDIPNLAKIIAENDEIPEMIYFKEIKDVKFLQAEVERGWLKTTTTGSDCYEITFKDDKKIIIPLEIGDRDTLRNIAKNPNLPKLHLWWKELLREKIPKELDLYLKYNDDHERYADSELKNTCKRCGKIWYLDADELQELEGRLTRSQDLMGKMGGLNMFTAMFNPMLAAQGITTMAVSTGAMKSLADELKEKSRCPECQSKSIERVLVDANEKISKKVITKKKVTKKKVVKGQSGGSLADELKKLNELKEQGILDEEEFKTAKRKLIEN